jgi:hypothetical protein
MTGWTVVLAGYSVGLLVWLGLVLLARWHRGAGR